LTSLIWFPVYWIDTSIKLWKENREGEELK